MNEENDASPASPAAPKFGPERRRVLAICFVLAAMTFAVFGRTLRYDFVDFDDNIYVYQNARVTNGLTPPNIGWAFTHADCYLYHPLTMLSHMFDCQLFGLNPAGHHLTNILLHTATAILLFLGLRAMTGALWRSAFVAAVFAIHPLHVESVAWVAERKDVLSGLFFMLTLLAYVRYARQSRSVASYGMVILFFAGGLLSKPMLVTMPMVLILLDYWPLQRGESVAKLAWEKVPLLVLSVAACIATIVSAKVVVEWNEQVSLWHRLENALLSCAVYVGQTVWPVNLAVLYPFPRHGVPVWEMALAAALVIGFSVIAWRQWPARPWLLVGWLWYLIMLLPVLGIIKASLDAHADRYTYLPQIGLVLAVAWSAGELRLGPWSFRFLGGGVIIALMVCAWQQASYWRDTETLYTHALVSTKNNEVIHDYLGALLLSEGDADDAVFHFQKALEIRPDYAAAYGNWGNADFAQDKIGDAIWHYEKALEINPNLAEAHFGLANAYIKKAEWPEVEIHYERAVQCKPDNPLFQKALAWVLATCPDASVRDGGKALKLAKEANDLTFGEDPRMLHALAAAFAETGQFADAVRTAQQALDLAESQSKPGLAEQLKLELKLYQEGKPYRVAESAN